MKTSQKPRFPIVFTGIEIGHWTKISKSILFRGLTFGSSLAVKI